MSTNDNRGTPFSENIRELWRAITSRGRIGHELKNVVIEWIRSNPAKSALIIVVLVLVIAEWGWSGSFL